MPSRAVRLSDAGAAVQAVTREKKWPGKVADSSRGARMTTIRVPVRSGDQVIINPNQKENCHTAHFTCRLARCLLPLAGSPLANREKERKESTIHQSEVIWALRVTSVLGCRRALKAAAWDSRSQPRSTSPRGRHPRPVVRRRDLECGDSSPLFVHPQKRVHRSRNAHVGK